MRNRRIIGLRRAFLPDVLTACGLIAAPFILPHLGFAADTMNRILMLGLFGIGFDILFGFTGLLSFGQAAFFGTGGFVAAYLTTNGLVANVTLALLIGTVAGAVTGMLVGLIALRRTGIYFAMITVAIAETSTSSKTRPWPPSPAVRTACPACRPQPSIWGLAPGMWALGSRCTRS
jgi:ABC-type branched-subunit amino acid transport system permease subunit